MNLLHKLQIPLIILFFLLLFLLFLHPVGGDGDYYHHLSAGKYIVTNRAFPYLDTFTFTAMGKGWVNHSWLSGVFFYILDNSFGPLGISLFVSLMAIATIGLLALLLKSYKLPNIITFPIVLLVAAVLNTRWPSRPEIFTYPFVILLLLIDRFRVRLPKLILLFPVIILLWANLYGVSTIVGVLLIILLMAKQFVADRFRIYKNQKLFYAFSLLSLPLSLVNGYGLRSLFYIYYIREIGQTEMEWFGALRILSNAPYQYLLTFQYRFLTYLLAFILLAVVVAINRRKLKDNPLESLLALSIFVPLFAFRQMPLAIILSVPLLGILLQKDETSRNKFPIILMGAVAGLAIAASLWVNPPRLAKPDQYPPSLVEFIKVNSLYGKVLNHPQDGGFLSYYLYPDNQIFADTRDDLYLGTSVLTDYYQAVAEGKLFKLLDKYKIDMIIGDLSQGDTFKEFFYSTSWAPVYMGSRFFVAIPSAVAQAKKIPTLDFVDPFSASQAKNGQEEKALDYYRMLVQDRKESVDDQLRLANTLLFLKKYDEAILVLFTIKSSKNPGNVLFNMSKDYLTALSYLGKGDCSKSKEYLDKTDQGMKGMMLFTPSKKMPPLKERGFQLYNEACTSPQLRLF